MLVVSPFTVGTKSIHQKLTALKNRNLSKCKTVIKTSSGTIRLQTFAEVLKF